MTAHRSPSTIQPPPDDPDDDDRLIGRVLSRREVLALMGIRLRRRRGSGVLAGFGGERLLCHRVAGRRRDGRGLHRPRRPVRRAASRPPQRRRGRERPSVVCRRPGAHRGTLLRQREPRALGHPGRYGDRKAGRWLRPEARLDRVAGRWQRVHPARGRSRRCLALRRARELLGCRERERSRLPARVPAHGRERQGDDHDDLPGLVPGTGGPHPFQDPDRRHGDQRIRVHVAAVLR